MTFDPDNMSDPAAVIQLLLDILSDEPGAIIYRGPNMWEALPPGPIGSTLRLDEDQLPFWDPPA